MNKEKTNKLLDFGKDLLILTLIALVLYWPVLLVKAWMLADIYPLSDLIQTAIFFTLLCTLFVMRLGQRQERQKIESEAYLERSIRMGAEAYSVLLDNQEQLTRSPIDWVTSARLIQRSYKLAQSITLKEHRDIYEAELDIQRHKFGMLLGFDVGRDIEFRFFTGIEFSIVWANLGEIPNGSEKYMISKDALSTVIRFASFPEDFEDPLKVGSDLTHAELEKHWMEGHIGIVSYMIFQKHFIVKFGQIYTNLPHGEWTKVEISEAKTLLERELERFPIMLDACTSR